MIHTHFHKKGFTLIELMVAVSLFAIVMTIATGALLTVIGVNRKAQSLKIVMNNLNLAMETMVRDIRTGTRYHCGGGGTPTDTNDCPTSGDDSIVFRPRYASTDVEYVRYYYEDLGDGNGVIKKDEVDELGTMSTVDITAPEAHITGLHFYVDGSSRANTDKKQPRVLMTIQGYAGEKASEKAEFNIQTTVSQRHLDLSQ